jgi:hypothetical protein
LPIILNNIVPTNLQSLATAFPAVWNALVGSSGVVFLSYLIYGGFLYLTSAGDDALLTKAKKTLRDAAIGIGLVVLAWPLGILILNFLGQGGLLKNPAPGLNLPTGGQATPSNATIGSGGTPSDTVGNGTPNDTVGGGGTTPGTNPTNTTGGTTPKPNSNTNPTGTNEQYGSFSIANVEIIVTGGGGNTLSVTGAKSNQQTLTLDSSGKGHISLNTGDQYEVTRLDNQKFLGYQWLGPESANATWTFDPNLQGRQVQLVFLDNKSFKVIPNYWFALVNKTTGAKNYSGTTDDTGLISLTLPESQTFLISDRLGTEIQQETVPSSDGTRWSVLVSSTEVSHHFRFIDSQGNNLPNLSVKIVTSKGLIVFQGPTNSQGLVTAEGLTKGMELIGSANGRAVCSIVVPEQNASSTDCLVQ